jgi:MFS family permease
VSGPERRSLATLVATLATMAGFGCGPLLAGALAEWAPDPLRLPFLVDLALIAAAAVGVWRLPAAAPLRRHPARPRLLTVPRAARGVFAVAALGSFVGFGALSLFTGLAPTFLADLIGISNHAVAGALVASTFVASVAGQLMLGQLPGRQGLRVGARIMVVGLLLLALGIADVSAVLFVVAGLVTGFGQGVAYRGGLAAINETAPPSHRAGLASSFFFCVYVGISIPLVGLGLLSQVAGLRIAGVAFALLMATLAVAVGVRGGNPVAEPAPGRVR